MTSPVAPDAAPSVPEFPALGDPSFNSKAYTWGSWMPTLVAWIVVVVADAYQNAISAFESATAAQASEEAAAASATFASSAANFKGDWSALSGALAPPASVWHNGRTWNLLSALANVAAAEPGVSSAWRAIDTVFPVEHVTTATVTMVAGYEYSFEYAGAISATMPTMTEGAGVVITVANGRRDNVLLRKTPTDSFMGKSPDDIMLNVPGRFALRALNGSWRGF